MLGYFDCACRVDESIGSQRIVERSVDPSTGYRSATSLLKVALEPRIDERTLVQQLLLVLGFRSPLNFLLVRCWLPSEDSSLGILAQAGELSVRKAAPAVLVEVTKQLHSRFFVKSKALVLKGKVEVTKVDHTLTQTVEGPIHTL